MPKNATGGMLLPDHAELTKWSCNRSGLAAESTHGLKGALRSQGGGEIPPPLYNSNCTKERSSSTSQVPATIAVAGWIWLWFKLICTRNWVNPPSPRPLKAPYSPSVDGVTRQPRIRVVCSRPCCNGYIYVVLHPTFAGEVRGRLGAPADERAHARRARRRFCQVKAFGREEPPAVAN